LQPFSHDINSAKFKKSEEIKWRVAAADQVLPQVIERQIVEPARHLKADRLRSAPECTIGHERSKPGCGKIMAPSGLPFALTSTPIARSRTGPMILTASIVRLFSWPGLRPAPGLRPPRDI
jgi:hypothetical protein